MIGRRPFLKVSLLLSAATAAAPLVGGCGRPANVEASHCWNPDVIPGLDLHFDATRLDTSPVDSTDFANVKTGAPIVSARGQVWTHTDTIGRETSAMVDAAPLSQSKIRTTFDAGKSKASVCILKIGRASCRERV